MFLSSWLFRIDADLYYYTRILYYMIVSGALYIYIYNQAVL